LTATIGQPVRRREDERLLRGRGCYVADIAPAGAAHAQFVRSPHAHARFAAIDPAPALRVPGVLAVLSAADWEQDGSGDLPCFWEVVSSDGSPMVEVTRPALAKDEVCHVGDTVAAVIAETAAAARDGADALEIRYVPLPAIVDTAHALDAGAPLAHTRLASNQVFDRSVGDAEAVRRAFAAAHHVSEIRLVNNRLAPAPIEPRAVVGDYDAAADRYTLWSPTQNPHLIRMWLAENSLRVPEHKIRVISPDVGGGFGQKIYHYPEEPIVLWASRRISRPVRWVGTRVENLTVDAQGRDHATRARLALDRGGRILALEVESIANVGAYLGAFGASIPGLYFPPLLSQLYEVPAIYCRVRGVYTNATPVDAYRGAGRPEAAYVTGRLLALAAAEMKIDPAELMRRNLVDKSRFPYVNALGSRYDSGDFAALYARIAGSADYAGLRAEQERLRDRGVHLGIGMAGMVDSTGGAPSKVAARSGRRFGNFDFATVRVHPTGRVVVLCGGHNHGQGHYTTFAQIVADRLGVPFDSVEIVEGDTDRSPFGNGTMGSRTLTVTGVAIALAADKVIEKGRRIAAHLLECDAADLEYANGRYTVVGTDRSLAFERIVRAAYHPVDYPPGLEPGLDHTLFYDPPGRNTPSAMHLCTVLVDPETGRVALRDYWTVDDVGRVINPMVVAGQVHGGLAQGIGQALMEACRFDASGQPLHGSFMDYAIPRASDLPPLNAQCQETLSPDNPLGVKGAGESGTIGAPVAVVNAVVDALAPFGVRHIDMPLTPERVWRAIEDARANRP
jgi:carbon-monoxide dehydrogenase large subunit